MTDAYRNGSIEVFFKYTKMYYEGYLGWKFDRDVVEYNTLVNQTNDVIEGLNQTWWKTQNISNYNLSQYHYNTTDFQLFKDWFKANKLTLNVKKTKYMLFQDKNQNNSVNPFQIKIGDKLVEHI